MVDSLDLSVEKNPVAARHQDREKQVKSLRNNTLRSNDDPPTDWLDS